MLRRRFWTVSFLALFLIPLGCSLGSLSIHHHEDGPRRVKRVPHRHVCSRSCHDHYYDGSDVVVIRGRHRHGPDCGHDWDGHHWVVVTKGKARVREHERHVHSASCGCVFEPRGQKWVRVRRGHVHGPHCGHVRVEGRWTIRD